MSRRLHIVKQTFFMTFITFVIVALLFLVFKQREEEVMLSYISVYGIFPLITMIGSVRLAKLRAGGMFFLYVAFFAGMHYLLQVDFHGLFSILWVIGYQIIPDLIAFCWAFSQKRSPAHIKH